MKKNEKRKEFWDDAVIPAAQRQIQTDSNCQGKIAKQFF
jgi:hypothetical protein